MYTAPLKISISALLNSRAFVRSIGPVGTAGSTLTKYDRPSRPNTRSATSTAGESAVASTPASVGSLWSLPPHAANTATTHAAAIGLNRDPRRSDAIVGFTQY